MSCMVSFSNRRFPLPLGLGELTIVAEEDCLDLLADLVCLIGEIAISESLAFVADRVCRTGEISIVSFQRVLLLRLIGDRPRLISCSTSSGCEFCRGIL